MKKVISLFLAVILLTCTFSFIAQASAVDEMDLSQYTIEDLAKMSEEEYRDLLRDFERVYDPFDTYDTNPIMKDDTPRISPRWGSGTIDKDGEYTEQGSHEMITAQALNVLSNDVGILSTNPGEELAYCLIISLASLLPDQDEIGVVFAGHFFHAVDHDNYLGSKTNTALTNCEDHYYSAVSAAKAKNMAKACEEIGRALHYLQDAGQPHHAANITVINVAHGQFESYVDERIDIYTNLISSAKNHSFHSSADLTYAKAGLHGVGFLVEQTASVAYTYRSNVNNALNKSQWDSVARVTVTNSIAFSAFLLYKFAYAGGIGLH